MTKRKAVFDRIQSDELFRKRAEKKFDKWTAKSGAGCWNWIGAKYPRGYGQFPMSMPFPSRGKNASTVTVLAHRMAFALYVGDPGELHVLHACDNASCVNPSHLSLGTASDNMRDMVAKGRHSNGFKCYGDAAASAKNSNDDALRVARLFLGGKSNREITDETGFKHYFVSNVTSGRAWTQVTGLPPRVRIKRSAKPKPRKDPARKLRWLIVGCLVENGPLETGQISAFVGEPRDAVLSACRRLEELGFLVHMPAGAGIPLQWKLLRPMHELAA